MQHQLAPVGSIRIVAWDKTQPRTSKSNSERKWNEALEIFRTWVIFLYFLPVVWHSDDGNLYVDIRLCLCVYQKAFQLMRWLLLIVLHASTLIPKMVYGLRENDEPFHQLSASQVNANLNHVVPNSATRDFTSVFLQDGSFNLRPSNALKRRNNLFRLLYWTSLFRHADSLCLCFKTRHD